MRKRKKIISVTLHNDNNNANIKNPNDQRRSCRRRSVNQSSRQLVEQNIVAFPVRETFLLVGETVDNPTNQPSNLPNRTTNRQHKRRNKRSFKATFLLINLLLLRPNWTNVLLTLSRCVHCVVENNEPSTKSSYS